MVGLYSLGIVSKTCAKLPEVFCRFWHDILEKLHFDPARGHSTDRDVEENNRVASFDGINDNRIHFQSGRGEMKKEKGDVLFLWVILYVLSFRGLGGE